MRRPAAGQVVFQRPGKAYRWTPFVVGGVVHPEPEDMWIHEIITSRPVKVLRNGLLLVVLPHGPSSLRFLPGELMPTTLQFRRLS